MKRMTIVLFSTMLIAVLTACGTAPAAPTATSTEKPIGLTGTFGSYPHLHFGFYAFKRGETGEAIPLLGQSFITIDPYARPGEPGYWIDRNHPHPPY